jgi:hypothetical protein
MQYATFEPHYRADINHLADEVRRAHGGEALEYAIATLRQHLGASAWKNCALWLQIVNCLNGAPATATH